MNELLSNVLREFDDPDKYAGAILVGSTARGDACEFSDVDIVFYAFEQPIDEHEKYRLVYRGGRLISLSTKGIAQAKSAFTNPIEAIETIQGLRDCVLLRDSENDDLSKLKAAAMEFQWTPRLRTVALREASYQLMGNAEEVHKVLRGLSENNVLALLNGAWGLAISMPMVMALKHSVLSAGDNLFRAQVCQAVGNESEWAGFHAIAIGERPGPPNRSQLAQQAIGAVWLYEETARLAADALLPQDATVVEEALRTVRASGLIPA